MQRRQCLPRLLMGAIAVIAAPLIGARATEEGPSETGQITIGEASHPANVSNEDPTNWRVGRLVGIAFVSTGKTHV